MYARAAQFPERTLTRSRYPGGGLQGFQTPIQQDSFKIDGFGTVGAMHQERSTRPLTLKHA